MNNDELDKAYQIAKEGANMSEVEQIRRNATFVKLLMDKNDEETMRYHYNLLREREYEDLYYDVRAAFKKRKDIEGFLLDQLKTETDIILLADILQLLGTIRSSHAAPLARKFIKSDYERQREVSLFVLGWVGEEQDIEILNRHMIYENSAHLRLTAASAHRQMFWRLKELKNKLLASLKEGFGKEESDEVIKWIIVMIECIAVKRLGLREDREDPDVVHGDLEKAKIKTAKFLSALEV